MKEKYPVIHKKFVITSTYCMKDRSIRYAKIDFIKKNFKLFNEVYNATLKTFEKWWKTPLAQKLEMKIRIAFGYSPATYVYDILWHLKFIFQEYEQSKVKKSTE